MKKSLILAFSSAAIVYLLIYIALFIKLATLGQTSFSGDLGPTFLPLGHIENSPNGFTLENKLGSIILPLLIGAVTGTFHYFTRQSKTSQT